MRVCREHCFRCTDGRREILDTGHGVLPEDIAHIFDPFFSRAGGDGLGLSVSHRMMARFGGRIEVESTPGEGTTFLLRFPLCPAQ
ncbi:MAG: ATP-binding protein [Candidatus Latescibacterota bacterium]